MKRTPLSPSNKPWPRRKPGGGLRAGGRLKARSKKRANQYARYVPEMLAFLEEHPWCQVEGCSRPSGSVHHIMKRNGSRLEDKRLWLATCDQCNGRCEDEPGWAMEMAYKFHVNRAGAAGDFARGDTVLILDIEGMPSLQATHAGATGQIVGSTNTSGPGLLLVRLPGGVVSFFAHEIKKI